MSDELIFGEDLPYEETRTPSPFFSPAVCAVAAFALAATGLLAQNALTVGISTLFGPQFASNDSVVGYYVSLGAGSVVQAVVALLLAVRSFRSDVRWEANVGRAAALLAVVALIAGAATILGAIIHQSSLS
ncbi:hypothetical protein [Nocardioides sp. CER19]|uniref:hypothetical protein n=1 Tax=Nocardioides sp. CER19 TaxID=3038538 RepID=UPI002449F9A4|nr:hypothetical protein [Nocardioides sp. CER19]MDH2413118.1 hypothetical protein [Nocardioides sp. CER19]